MYADRVRENPVGLTLALMGSGHQNLNLAPILNLDIGTREQGKEGYLDLPTNASGLQNVDLRQRVFQNW